MLNDHVIKRVGICGLGQMGTAASVCYKRAGFETLLWDHDLEQLESVEDRLAQLEEWMDRRPGQAPEPGGIYTLVPRLEELDERSDLVMDCIAEEINAKVKLFASLQSSHQREVILLTTTSGLSITEIGEKSQTGPRLAGTHFWNPAHLMPLVEVIRGAETQNSVLDRVSQIMVAIGKIPVRVERDVPGFIGNRLLHALWREALYLVQEEIATPQDVDLVARMTFGLRMPAVGPLENMDLVGLDLIETIHAYLMKDLSNDSDPLPILIDKLRDGHLGVKTGQGIYEWNESKIKQLVEKRDRQIVHQLDLLKQLDN